MSNETAVRDPNRVTTILATSNDSNEESRRVLVDPVTGRLLVNSTTSGGTTPGFSIPKNDYVSVAYPDTVTEVYTFKLGGSGGSTVATVTLVYTSSAKSLLSTAEVV